MPQNLTSQLADGFMGTVQSALGVVPLSDYQLIDERKLGFMTMRLELMFEQQDDHICARLRGTEFKGSGRTGLTRKAFDWPVADPDHPIELIEMADRILRAADPAADVIDPRGSVGRFFDKLFGLQFINFVPEAAICQRHGRQHMITARLMQERDGIQVTLTHEVPGRAPLWFRIPLESIGKLRDLLANGPR